MSVDVAAVPESSHGLSAERRPSVARQAMGGAIWMGGVSIAGKLVSLAAQLVTAGILMPEDYGVWAIALAASAVPAVLQGGGVGQVMLHRQKEFGRWENAGFWLSVVCSLGAALLILGLIPVVRWIFPEIDAGGPLSIIAVTVLLGGITVVPLARLQAQLRFSEIARNNAVATTGSALGLVALSWSGFGPYSLALPPLGAAAYQFAWTLSRSRFRPRMDPERRLWSELFRDSSRMMGANLAWAVSGNLDRFAVGYFLGPAATGIYFFAYQYCLQTWQILYKSVDQVLTPAFSRFADDAGRGRAAYLRAARMLAWTVVPFLAFQGVAGEPFLGLAFGEKWLAAVPVILVLSAGMLPSVASSGSVPLLIASGKFRLLTRLAVAQVVFLLVVVPLGGKYGGLMGIAAASFAHYVIFSVLSQWAALGSGIDAVRSIRSLLVGPLSVSVAGGGLAWLVFAATYGHLSPLAQLPLMALIFGTVCAVGFRWLASADVRAEAAGCLDMIRRKLTGRPMRDPA